jgi:hypothetical protein
LNLKTLIVLAAASWLPFVAPAFAQNPDAMHRHHERHHPHAAYNLRVDRSEQTRYSSGDVYVHEGRTSAPDVPVPAFAWRPEVEQEGVGADLVGPGSGADNPTGAHDVSR